MKKVLFSGKVSLTFIEIAVCDYTYNYGGEKYQVPYIALIVDNEFDRFESLHELYDYLEALPTNVELLKKVLKNVEKYIVDITVRFKGVDEFYNNLKDLVSKREKSEAEPYYKLRVKTNNGEEHYVNLKK